MARRMGTGSAAGPATAPRPAGTPVLGSERRHRSARRGARRKVHLVVAARRPPRRWTLAVLLLAFLALAAVGSVSRFYTDLLWFREIDKAEPVLGHAADQVLHRPAGRAGDRGHRRGQPVDGRAAGPALRAHRGRPPPGGAGAGRPLRRTCGRCASASPPSSGWSSGCRRPACGRPSCSGATGSPSASATPCSTATSASTCSSCRSCGRCSAGCSPPWCSPPCWWRPATTSWAGSAPRPRPTASPPRPSPTCACSSA